MQRQVKNKRIIICCDSESSIKALSSYKISSKLVLLSHKILETLSEINLGSLVWVPGHSDNYGNEKAHGLVRIGSDMKLKFIGPKQLCRPSKQNGNCIYRKLSCVTAIG